MNQIQFWRSGTILKLVIACAAVSQAVPVSAAEDVNFNRDIRPILAANCFACHGPDKAAREAELRLDVAKDAYANRDGSPAVAPGKPEKSAVYARITSREADERMPPKETGKTLSAKQVELIRRWIKQGAKYTRHWAFVKPQRPALPKVRNERWVRNEIDRFILAKIEKAGLKPSAQADAYTLVRRVSLDLIGLSPTPVEMDAFLKDATATSFDAAYERLVDRLLASPRYGERWARRWLDLARYSDTNGYEKDRPRSIWAYRDWVIDAFNRNMPFDRFTIEQLAGDMLPPPRTPPSKGGATGGVSQKTATGFHRNTMLNEEGGIDPLEFRFHAVVDRVATTGTTWLGLTLGCAQCHSHKFDPVSQQDYYRLFAFLNNADEPELDLPNAGLDEQRRRNLQRAKQLIAALPGKWPVTKGSKLTQRELVDRRFRKWLTEQRRKTVEWTRLRPASVKSNLPLLTVQKDDSVFASGDTAKSDTYDLTFKPTMNGITAVLLEALPDDRLPEHGPGSTYYEGTRGDFFLGDFQLSADGRRVKIKSATHSYARNRYGRNPVSAQLAVDGDPQTGWSVHARQGERHTAVFVLKQPLKRARALQVKMLFGRHFASSLGRFRISVTSAPQAATARDFPLRVEQLLAIPAGKLTKSQRQRLIEEFLINAPQLAKHAKQIRQLRKRPDYPTTLVMQERPPNNPRPTFVHKRGEFLRPGKKVTAATPQALHPFPKDQSRNRLGFARWLVSRDNPLTARVVVNRQWAALFGRGIVPTVDDFGVRGDPPSHPQLLDWLAVEFMTRKWSRKTLHKMIALSATYRQSSEVRSEARLFGKAGLLTRAPRPRLEAEIIRDSVLQAAGLLSTKMGGPGVRPPQPSGVTEVAYGNPKWTPSTGEDRYRRSIYTFMKRTAPFAMYRIFDASSGETCTPRRDKSNTPLQALTLLNDVMFLEAAQGMGRMLAAREGSDADRARYAFRRLLTRPPRTDELRLLVGFVQAQRKRFAAGELDAKRIAGTAKNPVDRAAWTTLARAMFGLDETVTRN